MKHFLITGGAGFIGVNLSRYLINLGYQVTVWDNLSSGNHSNIPPSVSFKQTCITEPINTSNFNFDGIFNLACPASPPFYQKDPVQTLRTCVEGTRNLLELATTLNIPILQASTSEVYGDPNTSPQTEEYRGNVSCTGIRACYDEGKRAAETLCFDYNRTRGTKIKVVRIFNTYGPFMSPTDGRIISNFINQALKDKPITIYGKGEQTRSFCYVTDMVEGLIAMIQSPDDITGPINLGNPCEMKVVEVSNLITLLTSSMSPKEFLPLPQDDPTQRRPDITKAKEILGWSPHTSFAEGLRKTITYFQNIPNKVMSKYSIGIVGGGATSLFGCDKVDVFVYDRDYPERSVPSGTLLSDLMRCDVIFICVPTPSLPSREYDTRIVRSIIQEIKGFYNHPPIVVRSTVIPGTCKEEGVSFFPEFLSDFINTKLWYIGTTDKNVANLLVNIINASKSCGVIKYSNIEIVKPGEAEMIKYMKNSFLAMKIAFCNEIFDLCKKKGIDYSVVREGFLIDKELETPTPELLNISGNVDIDCNELQKVSPLSL